ncbi:MAG TPA: polyprenyl synthetase family protein [Pyrinomonadaceae bacterium]|nr:polyprenyl synthetase family protein [Pyrinomonadaceae bacterium]
MTLEVKRQLITQDASRRTFNLISREMEALEDELSRQMSSNIRVIDYLGDYLRSSGGKRVRPALLILSCYAAGGKAISDEVIRMAAVMEMLHTATLVHDDIIDNADVRRGRPSVNARFGNHPAVLIGDWLYMSAFETALKEKSLEILEILTNLTRKMTEGEIIQLTTIGKLDISEEDYFDILKRKTAYLFSGCCEIGAILANTNHSRQKALKEFGLNLGIAFQIADDLLDFVSSSDRLGKSAGADLAEGKVTLPILLLVKADSTVKEKITEVMNNGSMDEKSAEKIAGLLKKHEIIEKVKAKAENFASLARKSLEILPQSEYLDALGSLPDFVISRSY